MLRPQDYPGASRHYGLLWRNNNDGSMKGVPADAFWSWGPYDSLIVVIPSLDMVVAPGRRRLGRARRLQPPGALSAPHRGIGRKTSR